jgi:hypothetical protein
MYLLWEEKAGRCAEPLEPVWWVEWEKSSEGELSTYFSLSFFLVFGCGA